jgi:hypothetical protein
VVRRSYGYRLDDIAADDHSLGAPSPAWRCVAHCAGCGHKSRAAASIPVWLGSWGPRCCLLGLVAETWPGIKHDRATLDVGGMIPIAREAERQPSGVSGAGLGGTGGAPSELSHVMWRPRGDLEFAQWEQQGRWLGTVGRGCGWWIGDWLRYGNARYGQKYRAAAAITGYDVQSLMNMAYVASRVDPSRRREGLSFSHHAELAALAPQEQERWLDRIEEHGLSVHVLRRALRPQEAARSGSVRVGEPSSSQQVPSPPRDTLAQATGESGKAVANGSVCPNCGYRLGRGDDGERRAR